mgnify:CR=1 FL=1
MNIPSRRFSNNLNLCICIHRHSAAKHSELLKYFEGYTHFQCYRPRLLSDRLNIVYAESIDDGLQKYSDEYDHILFVAAGVRIYSGDIINDVAEEIRSKPNYFAMAHILDWTWQDRWWELHEQFVLINAKVWKDIKRPKFGGFDYGEAELPVIERSEENFHDNYVPLWVKDSGEKKVQKHACPGWNLLAEGYKNGCEFYTWQDTIRDKRTYYYPEHESEILWDFINSKQINQENYDKLVYNQKRFVGELTKGVQNQVWATNSEDMEIYNEGEKFVSILMPASGFKFLSVYKSKALDNTINNSSKLILYDWNKKALDWVRHIHRTKITNIEELVKTFDSWKDLIWYGIDNKPILIDDQINSSFVTSFEKTTSYFGGPDKFWDYVKQFRESDVKFVHADVVNNADKLYKYTNGKSLFHISNIFATDWLVAYYGLPKTKMLFSNFISSTLEIGDIMVTGNAPLGEFRALV